MIGGISIGSLLLILVLVVLVFGTKKLKNAGGDLGSAIKSFRTAMKDEQAPPAETSRVIDAEKVTDSDKR